MKLETDDNSDGLKEKNTRNDQRRIIFNSIIVEHKFYNK